MLISGHSAAACRGAGGDYTWRMLPGARSGVSTEAFTVTQQRMALGALYWRDDGLIWIVRSDVSHIVIG